MTTPSPARVLADAWRQAPIEATHPSAANDAAYLAAGTRELDELTGALALYTEYTPGDLGELVVLNYAAGAGREAVHLAQVFGVTVLTDTNPDALALAEKRLRELPHEATAGHDWTCVTIDPDAPEASFMGFDGFDVVLCSNLFLHLDVATAGRLLALFGDRLNVGGLLAVQIPVYDTHIAPAGWTSVGTWTRPMLELALATARLQPRELYPNPGAYEVGSGGGPNHARLQIATKERP